MSAETEIVRAEQSITLAGQQVRERALERSRTNKRDLQLTNDEIAEGRARIRTEDDPLKEAQFIAPAKARQPLAQKRHRPSSPVVRTKAEFTREIMSD